MAASRFVSTFLSAAALLVTVGYAGVSSADAGGASHATASPSQHATTLPPIVPLEALLGMSAAAGLVGMMASRRKRA